MALRSPYITYEPRRIRYVPYRFVEPQPAPNSEGKGIVIGVLTGAALWAVLLRLGAVVI